jgi:hypothetical protein
MRIARLILSATATALAFTALPAAAQHSHGAHQHQSQPQGAYAGMQKRAIKAFSDQQLDDLRAGRGMSLALPAELNGYPGPAHALELAARLKLSTEQKSRIEKMFEQMQQEAKAAGEEVIAAETVLDTLFREKRATPERVASATASAAQATGRLRETHLRYHLVMMEVLSAEQVTAYNRLRGY